MFLKLKNSLSIFTLVVFLLPFVAEQIHAFEHRNDRHCTNTETHFCIPEHHCSYCDFVKLTSDTPASENLLKPDLVLTSSKINFYQTASFEQLKFNFSLRGPPSIS
jgi:hypothetical protein